MKGHSLFVGMATIFAFVAGSIASLSLTTQQLSIERSDRFWRSTQINGMAAENYDSLAELSRSADLVVIGRIEKVAKGREWIGIPEYVDDPVHGESAWIRFATVTIAIEDVIGPIRTPLPDRSEVQLEVFLPNSTVFDELRANVPGERAAYFLRNKRDGIEFYRFTNDEQGLLREFQGRVRMAPAGETHFLTHLDGRPFDNVMSEVASARGV